ncbi:prepilin-type cleavage/methylation domain-containing protein [Stenotrophomonas maltophilia]|uniref:Pilin n=2 Tax=Lysobacteraceae TaxID=32033 RepID=A0ABU5MKJ6_9GAMM|nr:MULTISPECIES: pilin [Stenotrophomonas]KOQ62907.1 fimbrial protein [Stenotrophomonas maltophilia]MBA0341183.1 prepilin-type cleavage/methylation domain-containing protein [Stenotrophomonas maltophilia]MBH1489710.1 pilin [Stenotrophomonas maltophilia]MBH1549259.1 pilin [Stenotrophomonas maltophilia]MBH1573078.1 pilin [Stenotrophomonas maltophilia]
MLRHAGFTLIELMIAVAIIAILSAIAIPVYQTFVARSQLTAALADIRPGKTTVESVAQDSRNASLVNAEFVGLYPTSRCTAVSAVLDEAGVGSISCVVDGAPSIKGKILYLKRAADGTWTCDGSAFEARYRPTGC